MTARLAVHSKKGSAMAERGNPPVELQRQLIRRQETKAIATYQTFIRNAETARPYPPSSRREGGWNGGRPRKRPVVFNAYQNRVTNDLSEEVRGG